MGIVDKLLGRKPASNIQVVYQPVETMSGGWPTYSGHNRLYSVWDCDIAWQCLDRIVKEVAKITPAHVVRTTDQLYSVHGSIQNVLSHPNEVMTTYDMTAKMLYTLYTTGNAFVVPVYNGTQLDGLYPVVPSGTEWLDIGGEIVLRLQFANGKEYLFPYSSIIHIRLNFEDEYMGVVREKPLLSNMQIQQDLVDGIKKGVTASTLLNGVVKYGTALSRNLIEQDVKAFEASLKKSESGILGLDNQSDFREVKRDVKLVDADTLEFVENLSLRHFGMSRKILDGTATKEEEEMWFHATIQPLMECLGQAFSRVLFTPTQLHKGHMIRWYSKDRLHWMSGTELVTAVKELAQVGGLSINEIRDAFGFAPLAGEDGNIRPMSLNYIDATKATQYQLEAIDGGDKDEKQTEDE